ncbi:unnamed protein product [Darwinula stevensoni]|uniref:Peroxin/Ferlin domain-containing protein n=1 Tax=Darwinula stevensoni TaxID=69355 RepID=A0A7R9ABI1_9CRUS|nr:unnamed protein product [Darwinula stevensoni]CAG0899077.1 unnamed protein product [Darwinula stevensoni]
MPALSRWKHYRWTHGKHTPAIFVEVPFAYSKRKMAGYKVAVVVVVWGLGYDGTCWAYTRGYGGEPWKSLWSKDVGPMTDARCFYVYENQRWNPLTGYSARGLPTDRPPWSDVTGTAALSKDSVKIPSSKWQWVSDWRVDYHTPGGVDKEGWQYALDFPASYHAEKGLTDYVRRRRWYRKCSLRTSGPWMQLAATKLLDVSFQVDHSGDEAEPVATWAVAANGDVLFRKGVTYSCPQGTEWEHVPCDSPIVSISVGGKGRVWAVGKDGSSFLRNGVTSSTPMGKLWFRQEAPSNSPLMQISAGGRAVWAVDRWNNVFVRKDVAELMPEGTCWQLLNEGALLRNVSAGPRDQHAGRDLYGHRLHAETASSGSSSPWHLASWNGGRVATRLHSSPPTPVMIMNGFVTAANPLESGLLI